MSSEAERRDIFAQLDDLERGLRAVLASLETKRAPAESVDHAISTLVSLPFDAQATIRAFREGPDKERSLVKSRLMRLADLDAVVRLECDRLLATTALAIERTRVLKNGLDGWAEVDSSGDSIDCVR